MRPSVRPIRIFMTLLALLLAALALAPAGVTAQGDIDPKERCKLGGWEELTRPDGSGFANQGECVKYVASEGGDFTHLDEEPPVDPPSGLNLEAISSVDGANCRYIVYLIGHDLNGEYDLYIGSYRMPFAGSWNGGAMNGFISTWPVTFTVYAFLDTTMPLDQVTLSSCGERG